PGKHRARLHAWRFGLTGRIRLLTAGESAEPNAACQQAIKDDQLLAQFACNKVEKYHPAHDFPPEMPQIGFDFSPAAVTRLTGRGRRPRDADEGRGLGLSSSVMPRPTKSDDTFAKSR
ncbi:MAG: hypothetical protein ABSG03_35365, partial [Bryobacteraceae bacterium]